MKAKNIALHFLGVSFSILVLVVVCIGLFHTGNYCYEFGYRVFTEPPVDEEPGRDVPVLVTKEMSEYDIARLLAEKGLVRDANLFFVQLKLSVYAGKLVSGSYTLNTSMGATDLMASMIAKEEPEEPESEEEEEISISGMIIDETTDQETEGGEQE